MLFLSYDMDRSGRMSSYELRSALNAAGEHNESLQCNLTRLISKISVLSALVCVFFIQAWIWTIRFCSCWVCGLQMKILTLILMITWHASCVWRTCSVRYDDALTKSRRLISNAKISSVLDCSVFMWIFSLLIYRTFQNMWSVKKWWHLNLDFDSCYRSFPGLRQAKERSDQSEHDAGKTLFFFFTFFKLVNVKKA